MEQVIEMCNGSRYYPRNLSDKEYLDYVLESYLQKLNEHQSRLFSSEQSSELICRDLDQAGLSSCETIPLCYSANILAPAFWNTPIRTSESLDSHLGLKPRANSLDPRCRFL